MPDVAIPYASELLRVAAEGVALPRDVAQARALATSLVELHGGIVPPDAGGYDRAFRASFEGPEGFFALVDALPSGKRTPFEPARLSAIEQRYLGFRWRLRGRSDRLRRVHGRVVPERVSVDAAGALRLAPGAAGATGEPADDVASMAVTYLAAGVADALSWDEGFRPLWDALWSSYLGGSGDHELLDVAQPALARHALRLARSGAGGGRRADAVERLVAFAEAVLEVRSFDPDTASRFVR